jgi:hypothetical protein
MATQANPFAVGTAQPQQSTGQLPPNPVQQPPQDRVIGGGGYNPGKPAVPGLGGMTDPDRTGGNRPPVKPMPPGLGGMNDPDRSGGNMPPVKPAPTGLSPFDPDRSGGNVPVKPMPPGLGGMNDPDRSGGNFNPGKPAPTQLGGPTGPQVKPPPNRSFIAQDLIKQYGFPPQVSQRLAQNIANTQTLSDELFSQYGTDTAALQRDPRYIKLQQQSQQLDREMTLTRQRFGNQNPGKPAPPNANQMAWNEQAAALAQQNKQLLG